MPSLRSILALVLALVSTLVVSCSSGDVATVPDTYTPDRLETIAVYEIPVQEARERFSELQGFIADGNWVDTRSFIHGPLGLLRRDLSYLAGVLLPQDGERATELGKEIFNHLDRLDVAAKEKNSAAAIAQFQEAVRDFDAYLQLVPAVTE